MSDFDQNNFGPDNTPEPDTSNQFDQGNTSDVETTETYDANTQESSVDSSEINAIDQEAVPEFDSENTTEQEAVPTADTMFYNQPVDPAVPVAADTVNTSSATMQRAKTPVWLFAIGGAFIGIILIVIAFITIPSLSNAFALATMSPAKYYAKVEKVNMSQGIDQFTDAYGKAMAVYTEKDDTKLAQTVDMKVTISDELTKGLGIDSIKTIEAKANTAISGKKAKYAVEYLYDNKSLLTMDMFMDIATNDTFIKLKELSDDYLYISQKDLTSNTEGEEAVALEVQEKVQKFITDGILSEKLLNSLLKKYGYLAVSQMSDVTLSKNTELEAADVTSKNTKITVTLSQEDLIKLITVLLEQAEEDEDIIKMCEDGDICTKAEYNAAISLALAGLESYGETKFLDSPLEMIVWVNNKGEIIGREFTAAAAGSKVNAGMVSSGKVTNLGFKGWVTADDVDYLTVEGTSKVKGKAASGELTAIVSDGAANYDFNVSFDDFQVVNKEKGYFNGSAKITSDLMATYNVALSAKGEKDSQQYIVEVLNDKSNMVTIDIQGKEAEFKDFDLPDKKDAIDAINDMDTYMQNADLEGFITNLQEVLNIEGLNDYLGSLVYGLGSATDDISEVGTEEILDESSSDAAVTPDTNSQPGTLPEGVEADENGYYSYEVDYDTIKAAGVGSTGYKHFNILASDIQSDFEALVQKTYGDAFTAMEPYMSNTVTGSLDEEYPYEYTYYGIVQSWESEDDFQKSVRLTKDSVTDQLVEISLSDSDEKKGKNFIIDTIDLISGGISDDDKDTILSNLTFPEGEDYVFYNFGDYEIYFALYTDYYTFTVSPTSN